MEKQQSHGLPFRRYSKYRKTTNGGLTTSKGTKAYNVNMNTATDLARKI